MTIELPSVPGGYRFVIADPPWRHKSNSVAKPGRNAMRHYKTMTLQEIAAMPVRDIVARDAGLLLWVPGQLLVIGAHIPIMREWGFRPTAMGNVWIKLNKRAPLLFFQPADVFMGPGHTTRKNAEFAVLGKRGRSVREAKDVREVIISPRREHSRKPDEFYDAAARYAAGPRLELFARQSRPGWTTWGNEATKFDGVAA